MNPFWPDSRLLGRDTQSLGSPGFPPLLIQLYQEALCDPENTGDIQIPFH